MITKEQLVSRIKALPPLPSNTHELLRVLNSPEAAIKEIVAAVECDLSLTASLLKICNSAALGMPRKVGSVRQATQLLGTSKILEIFMSLRTSAILQTPQTGYGLELGALWKHSLAVAVASRAFGNRLGVEDCDLLFTSGLLHDIGKVIISEQVSDEYLKIIRMVDEEKLDFTEAEREVLGFSHSEVGAMVAETWSLPETTVRCIRYHHTPSELKQPDAAVDAVYLANTLCMLLGIGLGSDGLRHRANSEVMKRNDLSELDLEMISTDVIIEFRKTEQAFGSCRESEAKPIPVHNKE